MKYLTLIRHAKSSWEQPDIDDMVRPLNQRGKESTILMGNWMQQQKMKPDIIITSPATRALHTAINIASWINYNKARMDIDQSIYFGGTKAIVEKLLSLDNANSSYKEVLIVGHEPYLGEAVTKLCGDELDKFPTCGLYRIGWEADTWEHALKFPGSKVLFMTPKLLLNKS
jgi:phosphohistidine phosphatase